MNLVWKDLIMISWTNRTWSNQGIRRAHVDVVDVREEKGLMDATCMYVSRIDKWWTNIWLGHYCR